MKFVFQTVINATHDIVEEVAEDMENLSETVADSNKLLNECVREHMGVPWWEQWWQWGLDIYYNRVPPNSDLIRPTTYGQWLEPQYLMMIITYVVTHVIDWIDARSGSKLCKKYGIKQNALTKVCFDANVTKYK